MVACPRLLAWPREVSGPSHRVSSCRATSRSDWGESAVGDLVDGGFRQFDSPFADLIQGGRGKRSVRGRCSDSGLVRLDVCETVRIVHRRDSDSSAVQGDVWAPIEELVVILVRLEAFKIGDDLIRTPAADFFTSVVPSAASKRLT